MIETNTKIIEFISGNMIGLLMLLGVLKVVFKATKNKIDDKFGALFGEWLKRKPKSPEVNPK